MPILNEQDASKLPGAQVAYPSASYVTAPAAVEVSPQGCSEVMIGINITTITGTTPTVTFNLDEWDEASQSWLTSVLASTALNATGFNRLTWGPWIASVANSIRQAPIPAKFRIRPVNGGTVTALNYSVTVTFAN